MWASIEFSELIVNHINNTIITVIRALMIEGPRSGSLAGSNATTLQNMGTACGRELGP
jgi:hypothetical protein